MNHQKNSVDVLICLYSSHEDLNLAKEAVKVISKKIPNASTIIVLSNTFISNHQLLGNKLFLNVKECYTYLSTKTYKMIKACDELFDFKYLVKWDVSTLDDSRCYRNLMHNGYDDRFSSCLSFLQNFIMNKQKDIDYHSHLKNKNDAGGLKIFMTRRKKVDRLLESNRDINTEKLFSDKVHYYSGKFYILSSRFSHFIATDKKISELFNLAHQHGCGVEDMTVGHAYKLFQSDKQL